MVRECLDKTEASWKRISFLLVAEISDLDRGGYFTCFGNRGVHLVSRISMSGPKEE